MEWLIALIGFVAYFLIAVFLFTMLILVSLVLITRRRDI